MSIDYDHVPFRHEPTEHVCPCGGRLERSIGSRFLVCSRPGCGRDFYEVAA